MLNLLRLAASLCVLCTLAPFSAFASEESARPSARPESFFTVVYTPPTRHNARLQINFPLDERACVEKYGNDWRRLCTGLPGLASTETETFSLEPHLEGVWLWETPYLLTFTPKEDWRIDQHYTVNSADDALRPNVTLTQPFRVSFTTPPNAAYVEYSNLWIDPSPKGEHGVSFLVQFLYPQPEGVEKEFSIEPYAYVNKKAQKSREIALGTPRIAWNHARTEASINIPLVKLGNEQSVVVLNLDRYPAVRLKPTFEVLPKKVAGAHQFINPRSSLLQIDQVAIGINRNKNLQQSYTLTMQANAFIEPQKLAKHLRVTQLPLRRNEKDLDPTAWDLFPSIADEDLARGITLTLDAQSAPDTVTSDFAFALKNFKLEQGRFLHVAISDELESPSGLGLGSKFQSLIAVQDFNVELRFMQEGSVLALGSNKRLGLHASGLDSIEWSITQIMPAYVSQVAVAPGNFSSPSLPFDAYGTRTTGTIPLQRGEPGSPQFPTLDLAPLLKEGKGIFFVEIQGFAKDDKGKNRLITNAERFVLATDLGLMIKKGTNGERSVFVCSLSNRKPMSRVKLDVLGANGLPVFSGHSDAEGRLDIPSLDGFLRDKAPTVLVARYETDYAYLPLNDYSRVMDTSRYGSMGRTSKYHALTHVFSQRDQYRPGETLHFGVIARNADFSPLSDTLPLEGLLAFPGGQTVKIPLSLDKTGMASCSWDVPETAQTGMYTFRVHVLDGSAADHAVTLGHTNVTVSEFQPETLSINATFKDKTGAVIPSSLKGWIRAEELSATIKLVNLFGLPAQNRHITVEHSTFTGTTRFDGYEGYTIHDPGFASSQQATTLPDLTSDEDGIATMDVHMPTLNAKSWGRKIMRTSFGFSGFEPSDGRRSSTFVSFNVSPVPFVLASMPSANMQFLSHKAQAHLDFIALDNILQRVDPGELTFVVFTEQTLKNLVTNSRGIYNYEHTRVRKEIARKKVNFSKDNNGLALRWQVPTDTLGHQAVDVLDRDGNMLANIPFYVAGQMLERETNATYGTLRVRLDKDDYAPGETVQVGLTAPFSGMGLLTLELDKVMTHTWFRAEAGESMQKLAIPKNFEGRAFVNVSFIRSLQSPDIYMQPHVYTVERLTVNIARRNMELKLEAPELVQPGETVTFTLSARESGRAIVFAVDEGVLQLTNFATPSPIAVLLLQRLLEVQTSQAFDLLMPDQRHIQTIIAAVGGDGPSAMDRSNFLNPFKNKSEPPFSTWEEVDVKPGGTTVTVTVPDYYNGKVRIMAVGSGSESVGSTSAYTTVRGPLVLTPQLPLMVAPGDEFEASFSIANGLDEDTGPIRVTLDTGDRFTLVDAPPAELVIKPGSEDSLRFRLRALENPGEARISLRAETGKHVVERRASLSVRPASPRMSMLRTGFAEKSFIMNTGRTLHPYGASAEAAVSSLPLPAIRGLIRYLDASRYGHTETTISKAFPYALFLKNPALLSQAGEKPATLNKRATETVQAAINTLRSSDVAMWDAYQPELVLTAYAADFLLTAREAGFGGTMDLERNLVRTLRNMLNRDLTDDTQARAYAYAVWVLSRYGDITTRYIEHLLYSMRDQMTWHDDITAPLIAATYRILRLDAEAEEVMNAYTPTHKNDAYGLFNSMAHDAMYMIILAQHFPERVQKLSAKERHSLLESLLGNIEEQRYTTFSTAMGIRALVALSEAIPATNIDLTCTKGTANPLELGDAIAALEGITCEEFSVAIPDGHQGVYWQVFSDGFDTSPPRDALSSGLVIESELTDISGTPQHQVKTGSEATVRITVRAESGTIPKVALVSLLPGGFEYVPNSEGGTLSRETLDIRDDRVVVFASIPSKKETFTYRVRAVNKGRYTLPGVYGEALYDQRLRGRSATGTLVVE